MPARTSVLNARPGASPHGQVSIARVYNYDVSRRRALKQKTGDGGQGELTAA